MTDRLPPIFLIGQRQRDYAKELIDKAPEDHVCIIKQKTRTLEQNAKFHAMCGDVAKQCKFMGRVITQNQWKVIFISGHAIATGLGSDIVPGIEGEFLNLRESSADMGIKRLASVIEYMLAWGAEHDVKWSDENWNKRGFGANG